MPKMAHIQLPRVDWPTLQRQVREQFTGLDPNDPSGWPPLPRYGLLLLATLGVLGGLWFAWLSGLQDQLQAERQREEQLKQEVQQKLRQAVNLGALKQQLQQVQQYVTQLEKQLPSKAEMDALLSDVNQAGIARSLQFELFRPGKIEVQEYYAELPIAVKVTGDYHQIGQFAADIAGLSRIVTLNNLQLAPAPNRPGALTLETTAKTFRYLDPEELLAQQNERQKADQAKKGQKK